MVRCEWAERSELELLYHDSEWGVPLHDDMRLFEFIILEGAQAGLSWSTVLKKRDAYRRAFDEFDARKIARYGEKDIARLLADPGIIRNRLKTKASIMNARAFLEIQEEFGSFDRYIWQFVGGKTIHNCWERLADIPVSTSQSLAMSKSLRERGFRFIGTTICYAFMQAVGMVNDHIVNCFRWKELNEGKNNEPEK